MSQEFLLTSPQTAIANAPRKVAPPAPVVKSATERILCGALIGDIVTEMTGADVLIRRSAIVRQPFGNDIRFTYQTTALSGDLPVGEAMVIWQGKEEAFEALRQRRMKEFLREQCAAPTVDSFDSGTGVLRRTFEVRTADGTLTINERLLLKNVEKLSAR